MDTEAPRHKKFDEIALHADVTVGEEVCCHTPKDSTTPEVAWRALQ